MTTQHAEGHFDVRLVPQPPTPGRDAASLGRQTIDKQFHGDLEATSQGEMLAWQRLAYVALEQVTGTLQGRRGSFVLVHKAAMTNGVPTLAIEVVPGSGTDELAGLTGQLAIVMTGDRHGYRFDYALPERVSDDPAR